MRLPIIVGFCGYKLSSTSKDFLQKICPLGVILFSHNIQSKEQLLDLVAELKDFDSEILIAIDSEGGEICRFSNDIPVIASPKAMARKMDWEKIEQNIEIMAQSLSFFGIDLNFAPVLDVVRHDSCNALQNRGFFPDPQLICYYNQIFWQTHQKYGVHTTAKHFAGLSKINNDPHTAQSIFEGNQDDFELGLDCYRELPKNPFEQSVMTSHILYPNLDSDLPLTFSLHILSKYLREQLQYQGIVFSDCLEMKASSNLYPPKELAQKALQAGQDILISSGQIKGADFCQELAEGIRDYFQEYPQKFAALSQKIQNWKTELQKHKTKKPENLPQYSQVVDFNKNFVEKKIYKSISKIESFALVAIDTQKDVVEKFRERFPNCNSSFFSQKTPSFQEQTLVFVIDEQLNKDEQLQDYFRKLACLEKQVLVISISTSLDFFRENFIYEEWILWGKNHLLLDSLLALFEEKF